MRVLVTGHRGYLGSVLTSVLLHRRHEVFGLDIDWFTGCDFGRTRQDVACFEMDVRDVTFAELAPFDAVVHLAGLSNDSTGDLDAALTRSVNLESTRKLLSSCREAGVARFVFASSCSVYGFDASRVLRESDATCPLTVYAQSKIEAERRVVSAAAKDLTTAVLRFATLYGISPRLRLDLVANDFTAAAICNGRIVLKSAGHAWRPLVHVEDAARAIAAVLEAPDAIVNGEVFNVVPEGENYRVIEIADAVTDVLPRVERVTRHPERDGRSYRVDGSKLTRALPKFSFRWRLPRGIRQLCSAFQSNGLTPSDWRSRRFRRAAHMKSLLETGEINSQLRREAFAAA